MLQIRIGWLAHAMRLMLLHKNTQDPQSENFDDIHDLSPSQIKCLMYDALHVENHKTMSWLQQKQIAGALNKVSCHNEMIKKTRNFFCSGAMNLLIGF